MAQAWRIHASMIGFNLTECEEVLLIETFLACKRDLKETFCKWLTDFEEHFFQNDRGVSELTIRCFNEHALAINRTKLRIMLKPSQRTPYMQLRDEAKIRRRQTLREKIEAGQQAGQVILTMARHELGRQSPPLPGDQAEQAELFAAARFGVPSLGERETRGLVTPTPLLPEGLVLAGPEEPVSPKVVTLLTLIADRLDSIGHRLAAIEAAQTSVASELAAKPEIKAAEIAKPEKLGIVPPALPPRAEAVSPETALGLAMRKAGISTGTSKQRSSAIARRSREEARRYVDAHIPPDLTGTVDAEHAAALLKVSKEHLERLRLRRRGPAFIVQHQGRSRLQYPVDGLRAWVHEVTAYGSRLAAE